MKEKKYFILGDIHGSVSPIEQFTQLHPELQESENILILLGDVGANFFFDDRDKIFKAELKQFPFTYFIIRGNHDSRVTNVYRNNSWHIENFEHGVAAVEDKFPYIKYSTDYPSLYIFNDKWKTLIYPGAYSVDKFTRIENNSPWFEDEQLNQNEQDLGMDLAKEANAKLNGIDLVLSHTCPFIYEPTDLFLQGLNQSMIDKTMETYLGRIEFFLRYKLWIWGHFHKTRVYPDTNDNMYRMMLFNDKIFTLNAAMERLEFEGTAALYDCLLNTGLTN